MRTPVIRFQEYLSVSQPLYVLDECVHGVVVLVHAFLRYDVGEYRLPSSVLGHEELHFDFLATFCELFSSDGSAAVTKEQVTKGEHAYSPLLFAAPMLLASPA